MNKSTKIFLAATLAVIIAGGLLFFQKHRTRASQRHLADIISQITSITVYDINGAAAGESSALASATSAPFPADVFRRAAAAAIHEGGPTIWKGSSLAILTLSDGTRRHARFSYYDGFFTVEGAGGRFVLPGAGSSEFQRLLDRLIQEQFVPKRHEQNNRNF